MKIKDMMGQFCILCVGGVYVETIALGIEAQALECDRCHCVVQRYLPDMTTLNDTDTQEIV